MRNHKTRLVFTLGQWLEVTRKNGHFLKISAPPSPPGRPVVIDISETKCTLRWEPSEDDGGADVKHYIVEYFRDVWEVWLKAKTTKDTMVTIDDLIPGSRYKFRIKAENSYGISEPGDESDPFDVGGVSAERYENRCPGFCMIIMILVSRINAPQLLASNS